eukprot:jgi/Chlat1/1285/Chrsp117S01703
MAAQQLRRPSRAASSLSSSLSSFPRRFVIVGLCFLCTLVCYCDRTGFSIFFTHAADNATPEPLSQSLKGWIPGGWAAAKYGGRRVLIPSFALWTLASLLMPTRVSGAGVAVMVAARVVTGGAQGVIFPAIHTVLAAWIPPHERSRAVSLTTSGMYLGSAISMLVLPNVLATFGVGAVPRVVGLAGICWVLLWMRMSSEPAGADSVTLQQTGAKSSSIDLNKLENGHAHAHANGNNNMLDNEAGETRKRPQATIPWSRLLSSPPVWAIIINNFVFHYAFYVLMSWMPTYFEQGLHARLASMGPFKMLPYFMMFVFSNVGGVVADHLIVHKHYNVGYTRKLLNTIGFVAAAAALLLMPTATTIGTAVAYATVALAMCALARGGFSINHMDIAPRQAGVLMALSNTAGTLAGVIGVALTGFMLAASNASNNDAQGTAGDWFGVFAVPAVLCVASAGVFVAFASGERIFD